MPLSRRSLLVGPAVLSVLALCSDLTHGQPSTRTDVKTEWMDEWIKSRTRDRRGVLIGALELRRFADPTYVTLKEISWSPTVGQKGIPVSVPTGFVTDLASVPRPFWSAVRPDGLVAYAAIIHDYLYWSQPCLRADADSIFRQAMADFKVSGLTATAVYQAVRVTGERFWRENAERKAKGEKRILRKLPDDPRTRWEDWKRYPEVFY